MKKLICLLLFYNLFFVNNIYANTPEYAGKLCALVANNACLDLKRTEPQTYKNLSCSKFIKEVEKTMTDVCRNSNIYDTETQSYYCEVVIPAVLSTMI